MELAKLFARIILKDEASNSIKQMEKGVQKLQDKMAAAGNKVGAFGEKMAGAGAKMTATITAPIVGIGAASVNMAKQFSDSQVKIQNSLGLTAKEAESLNKKAKEVWKAGFGESVEEVSDALLQVRQNMQGLNDNELEKVTKSAIEMGKTFDTDVNEVTRAANNIMKNFGISSEKAFDMMAHGAQNGLNFSNELFDNLSEYSPLWAAMGFEAEQMFGMLQEGAKHGVYNLDFLNDAMKEFQLKAIDGGKAYEEAMETMGPTTTKAFQAFQDGKIKISDYSAIMAKELLKIENQTLRNQMGAELFGTKWEDVGNQAALSMIASGASIEGFEGKMDKMINNAEQSFGQKWTSFTREAADALIPLGETLIEIAEDILPPLIDGVSKVANWFNDMSPAGKKLVIVIGGIVAAIGPLIMILGTVMGAVGPLIPMFAKLTSLVPLLAKGMALLTGPVGIAVVAIGALTAGGIALGKHLSKASVESDIFGKSVSESTKKVVGSYMDLDKKATMSLNNLSWSQKTITEEMAADLTGQYKKMGKSVLKEMKTYHAEQLAETQKMFDESSALTAKEEAAAIDKLKKSQAEEQKTLEQNNKKISDIINKAKNEKRAITEAERVEIQNIQEGMKITAVKVMSESEAEQKAILESMKHQSGVINAEMAAETAKIAIETKDKVVKEAEDEYTKKMAEIIRMRDESGSISAAQADKLIEEATRQRDGVVSKAEETHQRVIEEAQKQAGEHVDYVDWETGEIKSKWDVLSENVILTMKNMRDTVNETANEFVENTLSKWENFVNESSDKFNTLKENMTNKINNASANISETLDNIRNFFTNSASNILTTVTTQFDKVKSNMVTPVREANEKIFEFIERIISYFKNLDLKIPEIKLPKMPKIKVKGEFDLLSIPPKVPSISWNAKGGIFDKPTIFNTDKGLQGVGEAGAEVIMPLDTLKNWLTDIVGVKEENEGFYDIPNVKSLLNTAMKTQKTDNSLTVIFQGDWTVDSDERQDKIADSVSDEIRKILRGRGDKV